MFSYFTFTFLQNISGGYFWFILWYYETLNLRSIKKNKGNHKNTWKLPNPLCKRENPELGLNIVHGGEVSCLKLLENKFWIILIF